MKVILDYHRGIRVITIHRMDTLERVASYTFPFFRHILYEWDRQLSSEQKEVIHRLASMEREAWGR